MVETPGFVGIVANPAMDFDNIKQPNQDSRRTSFKDSHFYRYSSNEKKLLHIIPDSRILDGGLQQRRELPGFARVLRRCRGRRSRRHCGHRRQRGGRRRSRGHSDTRRRRPSV